MLSCESRPAVKNYRIGVQAIRAPRRTSKQNGSIFIARVKKNARCAKNGYHRHTELDR